MSESAATLGTILDIRSIMHLDDTGHIIAHDKMRGERRMIERTVRTMEESIAEWTDYSGRYCTAIRTASRMRSRPVRRYVNVFCT